MKRPKALVFSGLALLGVLSGAACQSKSSVCPPENPHAPAPIVTALPTRISAQDPDTLLSPAMVKVRGKMVPVDKVVHGSFCEDEWKGVVYVDCDAQVSEWEEVPNFLDDCSLSIKEGAVVYVAAHNNQAYYKGCSCHYTDEPFPSGASSSP